MSNLASQYVLRTLTAAALGIFLWRATQQWLTTPTLTLSLVIIGEVVTLAIYLSARPSRESRVNFTAVISTLAATFFFYFVVLRQGAVLAPLWLTATLQIFAILWQLASKLSLGRSFGLLPANRGIVTRGTYRIVRHPIYFGYLLGHASFLIASFTWYNLWLMCALYFFQVLRIVEEERLLKADPAYRQYMSQTKYRLLPGII